MNMLFSSAQGMAKGKIVLTGEIKVNIQAGKLSYQIHMSAFKKEERKKGNYWEGCISLHPCTCA